MAKLIHAANLADIKKNALLWKDNAYTNLVNLGIAFSNDGYIVGKGTEYQVPLASNEEGQAEGNRRLWVDNGELKLTDSARFSYSGPHIDYVITSNQGNSSTIYLTGTTNIGTRQGLVSNSKVSVVTNENGNPKLIVPAIDVSGGATELTLNGTKLLDFIQTTIKEDLVNTDAMVFAGTISVENKQFIITTHNDRLDYGKNSDGTSFKITNRTTKLSDLKTYSAGWTWKVVDNGGQTDIGIVEPGDMVMAVSNYLTAYNSANFTIVQANIDGSVTAAETLTTNGLVLGAGSKTVKVLEPPTNTEGYLKPDGANIPTWASFGKLTIDGTSDFSFSPDKNATLKLGDYLDITSTGSGDGTVYTLAHKTSGVTTQTDAALKKLKFDEYGHITGFSDVGTLTFSAQDANEKSVNASGVADLVYDGNTNKQLILKAGSNITLSQTKSGAITIASSFTNTWRDIQIAPLGGVIASIGSKTLQFSSTFQYTPYKNGNVTNDNIAVLDLVWAEVGADGTITYN